MNQPNHWHITRGIKPRGECAACDDYLDGVEREAKKLSNIHVGRAFNGHETEDGCECPQESCGLIDMHKVSSTCPEHSWKAGKTFRQSHLSEDCPGADG